jgi:hypothetical protein
MSSTCPEPEKQPQQQRRADDNCPSTRTSRSQSLAAHRSVYRRLPKILLLGDSLTQLSWEGWGAHLGMYVYRLRSMHGTVCMSDFIMTELFLFSHTSQKSICHTLTHSFIYSILFIFSQCLSAPRRCPQSRLCGLQYTLFSTALARHFTRRTSAGSAAQAATGAVNGDSTRTRATGRTNSGLDDCLFWSQ